ncbi:MAG: hypothetical protein COB23_07600 [Methylophaga sp.]|nr:MAG: hypothetical protein COB23_07600 [Methylophaga sp.]
MGLFKVYVHLLNEGTTVLRPVNSLKVGEDRYLLQKPEDYDSEDEEWEFLPESVVICDKELHESSEILVAKRLV